MSFALGDNEFLVQHNELHAMGCYPSGLVEFVIARFHEATNFLNSLDQ